MNNEIRQAESIFYMVQSDVMRIFHKIDDFCDCAAIGKYKDDDGIYHEFKLDNQVKFESCLKDLRTDLVNVLFHQTDLKMNPNDALFLANQKIQNNRYNVMEVLCEIDDSFREAILRLVYFKENGMLDMCRRYYQKMIIDADYHYSKSVISCVCSVAITILTAILPATVLSGLDRLVVPYMVFDLCAMGLSIASIVCNMKSILKKRDVNNDESYTKPYLILSVADWMCRCYGVMDSNYKLMWANDMETVRDHMTFVYPNLKVHRLVNLKSDSPEKEVPEDNEPIVCDGNIMLLSNEDNNINVGTEYTHTYCDCGFMRGDQYKNLYCPSCMTEIRTHPSCDSALPLKITAVDKDRYKTIPQWKSAPLYPFWRSPDGEWTLDQFYHCDCGKIWGECNKDEICEICQTKVDLKRTLVSEAIFEHDKLHLTYTENMMLHNTYNDSDGNARYYTAARCRLNDDNRSIFMTTRITPSETDI